MAKRITDTSKLSVGQYLSETQYYKIVNIVGPMVEVENERGFTFSINKNIIEEGIYTADQFTEEVKVSRTELINIFTNLGDTVFTVCFNKQPKPEDINDAIEYKLYQESLKQIEDSVTQYTANIEWFERKVQPILETLAANRSVSEDEGLKLIEEYKKTKIDLKID